MRIEKQIIENTLAAIQEIVSELPREEDVAPCEGPYQPTLQWPIIAPTDILVTDIASTDIVGTDILGTNRLNVVDSVSWK